MPRFAAVGFDVMWIVWAQTDRQRQAGRINPSSIITPRWQPLPSLPCRGRVALVNRTFSHL